MFGFNIHSLHFNVKRKYRKQLVDLFYFIKHMKTLIFNCLLCLLFNHEDIFLQVLTFDISWSVFERVVPNFPLTIFGFEIFFFNLSQIINKGISNRKTSVFVPQHICYSLIKIIAEALILKLTIICFINQLSDLR